MALTIPKTWAPGETGTATLLNTYWRDNLNLLHWKGAAQSSDLVKNADTTLADLPGMSFPVLSGEVWVFAAHCFYISNATADAKLGVIAPGGSSGRVGIVGGGSALADASTTAAVGLGWAVPGVLEDNEMVWGYVVAGGNGSVQIQGAQQVSTAVDTTFRVNSFLVAFRISTPGNTPIATFTSNQVLDGADFSSMLSAELYALRIRNGFLREEVIANAEIVPQDLPGMSFPIRAGETWVFFSSIYLVTTGTAHAAFSIDAPPGSSGRYGVTSQGAPVVRGSTATFNQIVAMNGSNNNQQTAMVNGLITANSNGRVQMLGCQETSTAINTTFHQESNFVAFRLV